MKIKLEDYIKKLENEKNGKLVNIPLYLLFALPKVLTF